MAQSLDPNTLTLIYEGNQPTKHHIKQDNRITFMQKFLLNNNVLPIMHKNLPPI